MMTILYDKCFILSKVCVHQGCPDLFLKKPRFLRLFRKPKKPKTSEF